MLRTPCPLAKNYVLLKSISPHSMMRLFIAIEISAEIKAELTKIVDKLKEAAAEVKWVRPEGMHLTLKFLGEVEEGRKGVVENILEKISTTKSFTVTFQGLGAFPNLNNPRVIWVGIEKGKEELKKINGELETQLETVGFPKEERGFEPHLTLGRVKSGHNKVTLARMVTAESHLALTPLKVEKISLIQSILKREGAEYRRIKEAYLKKGER
jgi:2'-5' RNA ligase